MKVLKWSKTDSNCKSMRIFYDAQGQLTPVLCWFDFKFKPIQAFMVALVACTNKEDQIKIKALEW